MLQQVTTTSPNVAFRPILPLSLTAKRYLPSENSQVEHEFKRANMLNKTMYHKIKNELSILKSIVHRIMFGAQSQDGILADIFKDLDCVFWHGSKSLKDCFTNYIFQFR